MSKKKLVGIVLISLLVIGGGTGYLMRAQIRAAIDTISGVDFQGSGTGEATLVIESGDTGEEVATKLVELGITKDFSYTYKRIIARNQQFIPGTFILKKELPANAALDLIADPASRQVLKVTIKEGLRIGTLFKELSKATGISVADFEAAGKSPADYGLPSDFPTLEGYLFPATYEFEPGSSVKDVLQIMVNRMDKELDKFGVSDADRHRVLTLASIIQKEARITADFYKVSRVFQNRLEIGMHLQSDATVSYGSGGTTVTTTDAERADQNGYNTYVHAGLPIGPIGAPGSVAIDAALHPADGTWLYFCAVNLKTGETVFSTTYAQHAKAVKQWQQWMRDNPGWNG